LPIVSQEFSETRIRVRKARCPRQGYQEIEGGRMRGDASLDQSQTPNLNNAKRRRGTAPSPHQQRKPRRSPLG
jgi:hypothetical protein